MRSYVAQQALSVNELSQFVLDSLQVHIAIIDKSGYILTINRAWQRFAELNSTDATTGLGIGCNYLDVCRRAADDSDVLALAALRGIRAVLNGQKGCFELEYPCHSPVERRWFMMNVVPLRHDYGGAVVTHTPITTRKQTELELEKALDEIGSLRERLKPESVLLRDEFKNHAGHDGIVGQSEAISGVLAQVRQVAATDATVLILGETGTGKELLASMLHRQSRRHDQTMVMVNCAALPTTLIEAELFGREKGAYTGALTKQVGRFELAGGSSLFLDEVGDLPLELQPKLLRVLQSGEFERLGSGKTIKVDVRVIAATNRDLAAAVRKGTFREDLYYRLNVFPVKVPPLRERRDDIPQLVWAFIKEFSQREGKIIDHVPVRQMKVLQDYDWPGNIRELRNVIERAMILSNDSRLNIELPARDDITIEHNPTLDEVQRRHILNILEKSGWKVSGKHGAAEILGMKPTTLESRMAKFGIERPH